jgi:hypothetical protein
MSQVTLSKTSVNKVLFPQLDSLVELYSLSKILWLLEFYFFSKIPQLVKFYLNQFMMKFSKAEIKSHNC